MTTTAPANAWLGQHVVLQAVCSGLPTYDGVRLSALQPLDDQGYTVQLCTDEDEEPEYYVKAAGIPPAMRSRLSVHSLSVVNAYNAFPGVLLYKGDPSAPLYLSPTHLSLGTRADRHEEQHCSNNHYWLTMAIDSDSKHPLGSVLRAEEWESEHLRFQPSPDS